MIRLAVHRDVVVVVVVGIVDIVKWTSVEPLLILHEGGEGVGEG